MKTRKNTGRAEKRRTGQACPGTAFRSGPSIEIYVDGSCLWTGGPGGAAVVLNDGLRGDTEHVLCGIAETTNNRAELIAVIQAIRGLAHKADAVIYSDSQYVLDGLGQLGDLARAGWKRRSRRHVRRLLNKDLWKQLYRLLRRRKVTFEKVEAHAGVVLNERADQLAFKAAMYAQSHVSAWPENRATPWQICRFTGDAEPECIKDLECVSFAGFDNELYVDPTYLPGDPPKQRRCNHYGYGTGRGAEKKLALTRTPWDVPVDAHRGGHRDFLKRYVWAARQTAGELLSGTLNPEAGTFLSDLFRYATSFRMLRCAWDLTMQTGSLARGVDGLNVDDYDRWMGLLNSTLTALRTDLRNGDYRPSPLRRLYVDKPGGRGKRPIDIPTVEDRIVDRALVLALAPLLEPLWHECSIGFRTGHGPQDGLATIEWHIRTRKLTVVQTADIRKAFTSLPKERLVHAVRQSLPADVPGQLATLVERIIRRPLPNGECIRKRRGIAQGSPLSPLLLNLFLNRHLDRKWDHQRWPMIRYADDILLLTDSPQEADAALADLRTLLTPNGLNLRAETTVPVDLQVGDPAQWLGYSLHLTGRRLRIDLPERAWHRLADSLEAAHHADDLTGRLTSQAVRGWLEYAAPAYRSGTRAASIRRELVDRVTDALSAAGTDQRRMPQRVIHHMWKAAHDRWRKRRRRTWSRLKRFPRGVGWGSASADRKQRPPSDAVVANPVERPKLARALHRNHCAAERTSEAGLL